MMAAVPKKKAYLIEEVTLKIVDYKPACFVEFDCTEDAPTGTFDHKIENGLIESMTSDQKPVFELNLPELHISSFRLLRRDLIIVQEDDKRVIFQGAREDVSRVYPLFSLRHLATAIRTHFNLPDDAVVKLRRP